MLGYESWGKRTVGAVHLKDIFNIKALVGIFRAIFIIEVRAAWIPVSISFCVVLHKDSY